MCKLLIIPGLHPKNKKVNWDFVFAMGDKMSNYNRDGLGYTAIDKDGKMFGERWVKNDEAFREREELIKPPTKAQIAKLKEKYGDLVDLDDEDMFKPVQKYGSFGNHNNEFTAITLHTRMATSPKTFANTHPFVDADKDTSLIHNGVISNVVQADHIRSTCDSERILNKYLEHEVNKVHADVQNMVNDLKGNFACGVFTRDVNGFRILDVFKSRASLSSAFIKELDTVVMSTDGDDIKAVCKKLGLTIVGKVKSFKEDTLCRFNAETGDKILELKYTDTASHYQTGYNNNGYTGGTGYHSRHTDDQEWDFATSSWKQKADLEKERADRIAKMQEHNRNQSNKNNALITTDNKKVDGVLVSESEWQKHQQAKKTISKLTTDQLVEFQEARKAGMSVEEAFDYVNIEVTTEKEVAKKDAADTTTLVGLSDKERDSYRDLIGKGFSTEEAIEAVINGITPTKEVITNVNDKLNEQEAEKADYQFNKDMSVWQKRLKN